MRVNLRAHPMVWVRFAALPLAELDGAKDIDAMWQDRRVSEAVRIASPSLARALERRPESAAIDDPRLYRSLRSYYSRMATRATPFGLMAGVFSANMNSDSTRVELDLTLSPYLRLESLDTVPDDLTDEVLLQANPGAERIGDGFLVPPRGSLCSYPEKSGYVGVSATLLRVMDMLSKPMKVARLAEELAAQTGKGRDEWIRYLQHLERRNLLVRPERIGQRAWITTHVLQGGATCAGAAVTANDKSAISLDAFAANADGAGVPAVIGRHAVELFKLLRLANPILVYPAHLELMAADFTHRFGPAAEVPLLHSFSSLYGIQLQRPLPPSRPYDPLAPLTRREQILSAAADAVGLGGTIDDTSGALLAQLAEEHQSVMDPPYAPAQELSLRSVLGANGATSALMFAGSPPGLGGRFAHMLTPQARAGHRELTDAVDRCFAPMELAELVVTPTLQHRRLKGITPVVTTRTRVVSVVPAARAEGPEATGAEDILLGVSPETGRFYLRSARSGRQLHLVQSSMASDEVLQPLEAFLLQVCRAQFRCASGFSWGALWPRTFLPGLRVGPVHLCTPRWLLSEREVSDEPEALSAWMHRWEVPNRFVARRIGTDRGILLRQGVDDDLLRHLLHRAPSAGIEIKEAPDALGESVIQDREGQPRVAEVVVTVLSEAAADDPAAAGQPCTSGSPEHLPPAVRSEWTAFDLSLPWAALPHFLFSRIGSWLDASADDLTVSRVWWEVREFPEPQLRLYFPAHSRAEQEVTETFWRWCRRARTNGELAGIAQTEHHVYESQFADRRLLELAHGFFAADAHMTLQIIRDASGRPERAAVQCSAHIYRMFAASKLDWAKIRTSVRAKERDAGRGLQSGIDRDLYALSQREDGPSDWLRRWRALIEEGNEGLVGLTDPLISLSLDRLCVGRAMRPHIYGAVRRLVDRKIHEERQIR